jgi:hypothetical protein
MNSTHNPRDSGARALLTDLYPLAMLQTQGQTL